MQIKKIPLKTRMEQLDSGCHAHPEYAASAILSFASIPVTDYLAGCEGKIKKLQRALGFTEETLSKMTYQDVAAEIHKSWIRDKRNLAMVEALFILSLPFQNCYEERKRIYEKNRLNSTGKKTADS